MAAVKCWLLAAISCAWAWGWADDREDLNLRLAAMGHLAADFKQRLHGPEGALIEESQGFVRLLPPKFRWQVAQPYPQIIVADGKQLKQYDPDLQQATVRPLDEALRDTPLALLSGGAAAVAEDCEVRRLQEGVFGLYPQSQDALFAEIVLTFGGERLTGLTIRDQLGQRAEIRFSGFLDVSAIRPEDFQLRLPPGTDVF